MTCCLLIILLWCFFKVRYLFREVRYVSFRLWHILLTWGLVTTPPSQFNPTDYRIPSPCLATSLPPVAESLQGPVALLGGINPARSSWCHPQVNDQSARLLPWKQAHFSGYIFWNRKTWGIRKAFVGMMLCKFEGVSMRSCMRLHICRCSAISCLPPPHPLHLLRPLCSPSIFNRLSPNKSMAFHMRSTEPCIEISSCSFP